MPLRVRDKAELLALCEDFIAKAGIGATKFGYMATGDLSLISKLRHKPEYDPAMSTMTRALDFLERATEADTNFAEGLD